MDSSCEVVEGEEECVFAQADESGGAAWGNADASANLWTAILYPEIARGIGKRAE